jgi:hypothetical protein
MVAEFEADLIRARTRGIKWPRPRGACAASSPSSPVAKKRTSSRCTQRPAHQRELAEPFNVARSTVYRAPAERRTGLYWKCVVKD